MARAEVVVLQSGRTVRGEIVLQNDDILIIRDAEGRRFQFPPSDIVAVHTDTVETVTAPVEEESRGTSPVALRLDMAGGGVFVPSYRNGGWGAVDLQIGTRNLAGKRIFLGGSVGYQVCVMGQACHFLPLMAVVSVPLTEGRHAPELGAALGYAFAVKQPEQGGLSARLDVSWRYQFRPTAALLLGVQTRFQQAQVKITEMVEGKDYATTQGRNMVGVGVRLAFVF